LHFSLGIFSNKTDNFASDGVTFSVRIKGQEHAENVVFQETVQEFDVWKDYRVDLSAYAGQQVEMQLLTDPYQNSAYDWAVWGTPRIIYFPDRPSQELTFASVRRYESLVTNYQGQMFAPPASRVDRGWMAEAIVTEIVLPVVEENAVVRSELYVTEYAEKQDESVMIEFLDENGSVLTASTIPITGSEKSIIQDYNGTQHEKVPQKLRITLDSNQPSLVFIKEPVYFTPRMTTAETEHSERPNVILISLDTLRADRLGCYGYSRDTSPNVDALAAESFVFTNAYSNSNWTLPSHTSMFTSLYPAQHQIVLKQWQQGKAYNPYDEPYYYLPQAFKQRSYLTTAITGGGFVHSQYGFNRGFDYHIEDVKEFNEKTLQLLFASVDAHKDSPTLLFFHTYQIHDYNRRTPAYCKYVQNDVHQANRNVPLNPYLALQHDLVGSRFDDIKRQLLPEPLLLYAKDLYDGGIAYTDEMLGTFFEYLREQGLYENSWIIVTSDHGEGFGEIHNNARNRSWLHARALYDDQIHIPLIVKPPKAFMQPDVRLRRVDTSVELVDIPPTLMGILGLPPHTQFAGRSLLPLMSSDEPLPPKAIFVTDSRNKQSSLIINGYKLIAGVQLNMALMRPTYELYQLINDTAETINLLNREHRAQYQPVYQEMKQLLDEYQRDLFPALCPDVSPPDSDPSGVENNDIDPKHLQRLKDLGYL
jgi:arylsulfatase A-like enzyme